MRAGFIGLGNIGAPMAGRLLEAGLEVTVHDLARSAAEPLLERGAHWASSPAEMAARCDLVGICVPDDAGVHEVVTGEAGVLSRAQPGSLLLIHSTVLPETIETLSPAARDAGVALLDAPMTGGAPGAERGELVYMVGGDAAAVEEARPYLAAGSKKILHTGPLGSGARLKLCVNTNTYFLYQAVYESAQLAQAAGVDLDLLREVGDSNGQLSRMALAFFDMFRQRGDPEIWPPVEKMLRGSTAIARKDLSCAMAMARESGVDDSALARVRERMGEIYGVEPAGPGRGSA